MMPKFAVAAAVLLLSGCRQELQEEERYLDVASGTEVTVPADGGTVEIAVSTNLNWVASATDVSGASVRWVAFDSPSGSGDGPLAVAVARNIASERSAVVSIVSHDRKHKASVTLRQEQGSGSGDVEGYGFPAYDVLENVSNNDVTAGVANGVIDGTRFIFDNGASLAKTGTETAPEFTWTGNSYYQSGILFRGWTGPDEAVVLQIPLKDGLCGECRMAWGWHTKPAAEWTVSWSNDGENWFDTGKSVSTSGSNRFGRDVFFNVDEAHPVAPGGSLWMRLALKEPLADDAEVTFCNAFLLTKAAPDWTELPSGSRVLYTCNFDKVNEGVPYELPVGYLRSIATAFNPAAFGYEGMSKSGTVASEWGAVRIGSASGAASLTFPALSGIGDGVADLKVSFKAVLYQAATILSETEGKASCNIAVTVAEGEGTVENGSVTDLANWTSFEERSVVVKGAGKNTRISIGIGGGSGDRRFYLDDVVIEAVTDIVVPDVVSKSLDEVLSAADGVLSSSWKTSAVVVSDPSGGNCPENTIYVMDGDAAAEIVTEDYARFKPGDRLTFALKNAKKSGKAITLSQSSELVAESGDVPSAKNVGISELSSNECALVEIKGVQAADDFVGKTFGSGITMENASKAGFRLGVLGTASFAEETVPANSGSVRGIVVGGKLYPRTAGDIVLDMERLGDVPVEPETFRPLVFTFDNQPDDASKTTTAKVVNGTLEDNVFTYDGGATIELIGSDSGKMTFAQAKNAPYNVYLTSSGWVAESTCYRLSAPVDEEISGSVALTFAINGSKVAGKKFNVSISSDGENWKPAEYIWTVDGKDEIAASSFAAQSTIAKGITRARFAIPESEKIAAGGRIWFRIDSQETFADAVQLGFGFVVAPGAIANTPEPAGAVLFNNFEDCVSGSDYMLGADMRAFGNIVCPEWAKSGWDAVNVASRYGYVFCGGAKSGDHGLTTPPLSDIEGTADVTLTFKSCLYMPSTMVPAKDDICVKIAEGPGIVDELVWDTPLESDLYGWHTATVKIRGAESSTRVFIGAGAGKTASGDRRMFIDDILIMK